MWRSCNRVCPRSPVLPSGMFRDGVTVMKQVLSSLRERLRTFAGRLMAVGRRVVRRRHSGSGASAHRRAGRWIGRQLLVLSATAVCGVGGPVSAQGLVNSKSHVLDISKLGESNAAEHATRFRATFADYFDVIRASRTAADAAKQAYEQAPTPENEAAMFNAVARALIDEEASLRRIVGSGEPLGAIVSGVQNLLHDEQAAVDGEIEDYGNQAAAYEAEEAMYTGELRELGHAFSAFLDSDDPLPWDARLAVAIADAHARAQAELSSDTRTASGNATMRREDYDEMLTELEGYQFQVKQAVASARARAMLLRAKGQLMHRECEQERKRRGLRGFVDQFRDLGTAVQKMLDDAPDWSVPVAPSRRGGQDNRIRWLDHSNAHTKEVLRRVVRESSDKIVDGRERESGTRPTANKEIGP